MTRKLENIYLDYLLPTLNGSATSLLTMKIFLLALRDFFSEKISRKFLTYIATQLYYEINKPPGFYNNPALHELGKALENASEVDYYFRRRNKNKEDRERYKTMLRELKKFYDKHKSA